MSTVDVNEFRTALSRFATGIVIITAMTPEGPKGFTCQTFGSLSLNPTLVSFAATSTSSSWQAIKGATSIGISVLAEEQAALATKFGKSAEDKFAGVEVSYGPAGSPLIVGALTHLEGDIVSLSTHGDHDVAVVMINYLSTNSGKPLIYFESAFTLLK
jgi:flavin reductase (DIM6/NTAB) family NADH-FMN oxidoreductase RutF